ncbi:MAG: 5-formyltetrahydrofolate cyclo-ligase [Acidiferrobacterales bacterium]
MRLNAKSTKAELRRTLRAQRVALSLNQQTRAANRLAAHVLATPLVEVNTKIACYVAHDGEIDPRAIVEHIWARHKYCYFPIVPPTCQELLWFAPADTDTTFAPNRFEGLEPVIDQRQWVRAQALDLILLPLVAFDGRGNRLGRGGGYYDRSLTFLREREKTRTPTVIGLAHDFQHVDHIDVTARDIPLQAVITDEQVYTFG